MELAGGFGRPDAQPLASRIEQSFRRRLESLPAATRAFLLTAASEPIGDVTLLWRAAEKLGIGRDAADPAEAAGLIALGARVRFRHPLVRAAVYRAATVPDRREAHRALAEATDPEVDPDRRAWHRASAAAGPDEAVAAELERSAARAQARGGVPAAAALLERATELTADPVRRGPRASPPPRRSSMPARPTMPLPCSAMADLCLLDRLDRAKLVRLRARSCSPAGMGATLHRCCSRRRSSSNHSTPSWPGRPTSMRLEPPSSPAVSAVTLAWRRSPRPLGPRPAGQPPQAVDLPGRRGLPPRRRLRPRFIPSGGPWR